MSKYKEIDIGKVRTFSIHDQPRKVDAKQMSRPFQAGQSYAEFWDSLPNVLAVKQLRELVDSIIHAVREKKSILMMMGAHVIKTGLSPIIINLMENGIVQGIALNGAGAIHDVELAYFGRTSEDVAVRLKTGEFGMAAETAAIMNNTLVGSQSSKGLGEALGERIVKENPQYTNLSILGRACALEIPVTVHVAIGTDIVHQHPNADGAAIGKMSLRDFRIWANLVSQIGNGGVVLLFGSAVILPEVFLKALTVARNVKGDVSHFTTANFDMLRHYRPRTNVVERPCLEGGQGFEFTGHHEIMIPLLSAAIKEALTSTNAKF